MQKTVQEIKNLIADHRSYICSEFCDNPSFIYEEISKLKKLLEEIIELEEKNNQK